MRTAYLRALALGAPPCPSNLDRELPVVAVHAHHDNQVQCHKLARDYFAVDGDRLGDSVPEVGIVPSVGNFGVLYLRCNVTIVIVVARNPHTKGTAALFDGRHPQR